MGPCLIVLMGFLVGEAQCVGIKAGEGGSEVIGSQKETTVHHAESRKKQAMEFDASGGMTEVASVAVDAEQNLSATIDAQGTSHKLTRRSASQAEIVTEASDLQSQAKQANGDNDNDDDGEDDNGNKTTEEADFKFTVSGASGSERFPCTCGNGKYFRKGTENGKPSYKNNAGDEIQWAKTAEDWAVQNLGSPGEPKWTLVAAGHHRYWSEEASATPPEKFWQTVTKTASTDISLEYKAEPKAEEKSKSDTDKFKDVVPPFKASSIRALPLMAVLATAAIVV